ncbi:protein toll-like [Toxorhynchites rutilus septentrionalis]|uniref:protein toll-like n=1 Tax=Toxorhynchites rutilus septentrionalis TaxID=329112 RepID=UPI002479A3BF|nr:protein toll-like [Toxorhynchites rutilus septentrionalis]
MVTIGVPVFLLVLLGSRSGYTLPQRYASGDDSAGSRFKCFESSPSGDCSCMNTNSDYEIQCPVLNPEIIMKIKPDMYAQVQCYEKSDFSDLPVLNVGNTTQVKIIHCPLQQDKSIMELIQFLGVKHVEDFWYQSYGKDFGVQLMRHHFKGMLELEKLFISSGMKNVQADIFEELPNLKWLVLRSNQVKVLGTIFEKLPHLAVLELGANQISEIRPSVFKNQRKLRHLNLWRNDLRNISKELFEGADALQELDLSVNSIETISHDVFSLLPELTALNLGFNRFRSIPEKLLSGNAKLSEFKLINNQAPLEILPGKLLGDLRQLKTVIVSRCSLASLHTNLFRGSIEITDLDLSYNMLSYLPEMLLYDQIHLQNLDLSFNELEALPERLFESNADLLTLSLSYNHLNNLSAGLFGSLAKLTELYLDNNNLHSLDQLTFISTRSLESLYMQNNRLELHETDFAEEGSTPFQYMENLRVLNLRNNSIASVFRDWNQNNPRLHQLDLSYNDISSLSYLDLQFASQDIRVNLSHNHISEIDLKEMEPIITSQREKPGGKIQIDVNDNPLDCNCDIFAFVRYQLNELDPIVYKRIQFSANNLRCSDPQELREVKVSALVTKNLLCHLDQQDAELKHCPEECSCFVRPLDRRIIVNCTGKGLSRIPALPQPDIFGYNFIELLVENNNISELPTERLSGYAMVAELYARNNAIVDLLPENLPRSMRVLDLTQNKLTRLNQSVVEALNSSKRLVSLLLANNRWQCDCDSSQFLDFIQRNHRRAANISQLFCEDGRAFVSITTNELCGDGVTTIIVVSIALAIMGLLIGLLTAVFFTYRAHIKVWLFAHDLCLGLVSEEELDKDKLYDAFISYSHKDEQFVAEQLVPTLEKQPMNFKTCWHMRDWTPGEMITTQITSSVENSRRTIVVLSKNFLESNWAQTEFRTAYLNAMADKRYRVIVIVYGDIGDIEDIADSELRAYLKMTTYVRWDDPWFWNKLRYAMPHPPVVKGLKGKVIANTRLMSSVDDKLELIPTTPPSLRLPLVEMTGTIGKTTNGDVSLVDGFHLKDYVSGHVNGAFAINSNSKQSDV